MRYSPFSFTRVCKYQSVGYIWIMEKQTFTIIATRDSKGSMSIEATAIGFNHHEILGVLMDIVYYVNAETSKEASVKVSNKKL